MNVRLLIEPFLDPDFVFHHETEYRMTCSIFAPLKDGLERADLEADDIDLCLLVGGSCLIPQVVEAVRGFLRKAEVLTYDTQDALQTAVARGAAYHSLALALFGRGLVEPVTGASLGIQTSSGPVVLVPRGASLPYPAPESWATNKSLQVPETSQLEPLTLRVELLDGDDRRLMTAPWVISPPTQRGEPLLLKYRLDENQSLTLRLEVDGRPEQTPLEKEYENPFANIVNPNSKIQLIEELEEEMRTHPLSQEQKEKKVLEIAGLCAELGQREKAMGLLQSVLRVRGADANLLNRMGILAGEMGDRERERKFYREAANVSNWGGPLFNLALSLRREGRIEEALQSLDEAIERDDDPCYFVLRTQLAEKKGRRSERESALREAFERFEPVDALDDWELYWYETAARMAGHGGKLAEVSEERKRRRESRGNDEPQEGTLPEIRQALQKRGD